MAGGDLRPQRVDDPTDFSEEERVALCAALVCVDESLTAADTNFVRRQKKWKVLEKRREALRLMAGSEERPREALESRANSWNDDQRNLFFVEVCFAQPFAPYELDFKEKDRLEALAQVAELIGLPPNRAATVVASIASARKAHRHVAWGRIAVVSVLGTTVLAVGGYFAAPVIAAQLGAAAGLGGAAAISHGLALLGGGSLAAGGYGMAGGLWLVTGLGAAAGALGGGGGALLYNLGANVTQEELMKLQVTFREVILRSQLRSAKQAAVLSALEDQLTVLWGNLAEERELNDNNAHRLKRLEKLIAAYDDSIGWMKKQAAETSAT